MIELRQGLQAKLKTICDNVYYQWASENSPTPYIVYMILNFNNDGEYTNIISLEVDIWDIPANGDTTTIETLEKGVINVLNKQTISLGGVERAIFYFTTSYDISNQEENIRRKKLVFEGHSIGEVI